MSDDDTQPAPTLMRRRWWVTFTVALAVLVVVVWWLRQPDGEPATEDPADTGSSAPADAPEAALVLPDTFSAGGLTWTQDTSDTAQAALAAALGDGFEGRTTAQDGTPGGAVYLPDGGPDATDPLISSIEVSADFVTAPVDTAAGIVEANLGQDVAVGEVGDGAVACGFLPVTLEDGSPAQQWICALARGTTVVNLLWPLTVDSGDLAAEGTTAFFEAAVA